jgi:methyltransferase family protein
MKRFWESVVQPYFQQMGYSRLCEVGAQFGENTAQLLAIDGVRLSVIDPCLDADLQAKYSDDKHVDLHPGLSLEVLPSLDGPYDCILLDGDHNWYTVYHELRTIHERGLCRPGGAVLLHDVSWPYGRRDMYFKPEAIPAEFRQPMAQGGIVRGHSALSESDGVNAHLFNAVHEGGPRNGVLTAIEDFLAENPRAHLFHHLDVQYGLAFLHRKTGGEAEQAFRRFRRDLNRRVRVGALKNFVGARAPRVYAALKRVRDAVHER